MTMTLTIATGRTGTVATSEQIDHVIRSLPTDESVQLEFYSAAEAQDVYRSNGFIDGYNGATEPPIGELTIGAPMSPAAKFTHLWNTRAPWTEFDPVLTDDGSLADFTGCSDWLTDQGPRECRVCGAASARGGFCTNPDCGASQADPTAGDSFTAPTSGGGQRVITDNESALVEACMQFYEDTDAEFETLLPFMRDVARERHMDPPGIITIDIAQVRATHKRFHGVSGSENPMAECTEPMCVAAAMLGDV